jgi:hypothetical protein
VPQRDPARRAVYPGDAGIREANMMKSLKVLTMAAAVAAVPCARAADLVQVDVPFKFMVNGQQFSSGVYLFEPSENGKIVQVHTRDHWNVALAVCAPERGTMEKPGLLFHRYGDQHFLKAVSIGKGLRVSLPTTPQEQVAAASQGEGGAAASGRP